MTIVKLYVEINRPGTMWRQDWGINVAFSLFWYSPLRASVVEKF